MPKVGHGPKMRQNELVLVSVIFTRIPLVFHSPYIKPLGHGSIGLLKARFFSSCRLTCSSTSVTKILGLFQNAVLVKCMPSKGRGYLLVHRLYLITLLKFALGVIVHFSNIVDPDPATTSPSQRSLNNRRSVHHTGF